MSVAIIDGLLRQDIALSDISGNCVTGNCTWDGYQSLGVCTSVADISPTIAAKCRKKGSQFHPAGCNYSVSAIDENPTALRTVLQASEFGQTLWVGASSTVNYIPPGIDTLSQFYVIYVPNLDSWDKLDHTEDHSDQLVALQATLSLCLNTYHTNMTLGVTNTTLMGKIIDLDWQTGSEIFKEESYSTVTTMHKGGRFWMFKLNQKSFQDHLSLQTFTGTAWMSSRAEESRGGGNYTENDVVRAIAAKLYGDRNGMRGLQDLLDNLAISMSNGYVMPLSAFLPQGTC